MMYIIGWIINVEFEVTSSVKKKMTKMVIQLTLSSKNLYKKTISSFYHMFIKEKEENVQMVNSKIVLRLTLDLQLFRLCSMVLMI